VSRHDATGYLVIMPLHDPGLRPALEVARPDDFAGARRDPVPFPEPWRILFGGESDSSQEDRWHNASVTGRWHTPDGREIIDVEWSVRGELWSETYFAQPKRMRKRW
jgi:hypothetical protein